VVWNLLSNAIKFTPEGGHVVVEILQEETNATLVVKDTGVGIRPEFLPRVFEPFSQADSTTERGHGGLGLGLAIVRHLVEQHGGTIHAESAGEGQGATFTVRLPLSPVRTEPAPGGSLETDFKPSLNTVSVLIVEDHGDSREAAVVALELAGASVKAATSVREALDIIAEAPPNVVLCDIGLPEEDGFGFIKKLRSLPRDRGGSIPAAALTAYTRPEDRLRALQAGFQIHLAKPVDPSELVAAIATLAGTATPRRM
jgi:CheY-like chemotaxis protein